MAQFIGCRGSNYIYDRDGRRYLVSSRMLISLFNTCGYCADPSTRSHDRLPVHQIEQLFDLATDNGDQRLVDTIRRSVQPLVQPYGGESSKVWKYISEIGLYLVGWNGPQEPYPTYFRPVNDMVRMELTIDPILTSIYEHPSWNVIRTTGIVEYDSKDALIYSSPTIGDYLDAISDGILEDYPTMGRHLIFTADYYSPNPNIPTLLISNLTTTNSNLTISNNISSRI